jgi:SAM-dependent methyltransferase
MNEPVKNLLKRIHIYYPVQGFYRRLIFGFNRFTLRRQYAKYRGSGYHCNYCGNAYTKFAPWQPGTADRHALMQNAVIAGYGEHIICPYCLSTARERLLKAVVETYLHIANKTILHISPEKPLYDFIKQYATVITADYAPGFYTHVDSLVQFADATILPFNSASFDIVIGNHIMEHIPDDSIAMAEIHRVLRPNGMAVLQVPFSANNPSTIEEPAIDNPSRQSALFGQHDHVRIYTLHDYIKRLEKAGFTVDYRSYESLQPFHRYAIQPGEGFMFIRK